MDPKLLSLLPDAAKLHVLRHLGQAQAAKPPQQLQDRLEAQQDGDPAATSSGTSQDSAAGTVPLLLARRALTGGLAIVDGFLGDQEVKAAHAEAQQVLQAQARSAGMVTAGEGRRWASSAVRGDHAAWLPTAGELSAKGRVHLAAAVERLLALRPWLARQGYDVGGRPSFQLACYPGGGTRYVRHRDASVSVPYRSATAILYLNPSWQAEHSGALCVYSHTSSGADPCAASAADQRLAGASSSAAAPAAGGTGGAAHSAQQLSSSTASSSVRSGLDEGHPATVVPPVGGRLVVMDSRLLHEVLPAQAERYALAVWFSKTPPAAAAAAATSGGTAAPTEATEGPAAAAAAATEGTAAAAEAAGGMAAAAEAVKQAGSAEVHQQPEQGQQEALVRLLEQMQLSLRLQEAGQQAEQQLEQQPTAARPPSVSVQPPAVAAAAATAPLLGAAPNSAPGTIFVSVPAYRDSEAQWTLADLFARAARPERVKVGVCWQLQLPEDAGMMRLAGEQRWLSQVRQLVLPASEATGPCKARALAQQLWEGEEFHLQIDSHMRFVEGWDETLLRMLRQAETAARHPRVVLSTYPPGYQGEGADAVLPAPPLPTVLCASGWGEQDGLLRIRGRKLREPLAAPTPALFWAAGLSFSRAQLLAEAPYRRDLPGLFFGEEMLQLQRMWCAGWDVFTPHQAVAFHLWTRKHRPTFWQDSRQDAGQRRRSQRHVVAALAGERGNSSTSGTNGTSSGTPAQHQRSLQQFWEHCGVDFSTMRISDRARNGGLPADAFLDAAAGSGT